MKTIVHECYSVVLLHIIVMFLPVLGSPFLDFEHFNDLRNNGIPNCKLHCPFGFESDIEGNPMCRCYDPCMSIYCFRGTKCVIEKLEDCVGPHCKPEAICKKIKSKKKIEKDHQYLDSKENEAYTFLDYLQQDSVTKVDEQHAVCFQDLPTDALRCRRKRRRYFYDSISGLCIKFRGCKSKGNNFAKKRDCKRLCIKGRNNQDVPAPSALSEMRAGPGSDSITTATDSCSASFAEVKINCPSRLAKRWYYSSRMGICIKIKGCPTSEKLFLKRRDCKRQCIRKHKSEGRWRKRKGNRKSRSRRRNQNGGMEAS